MRRLRVGEKQDIRTRISRTDDSDDAIIVSNPEYRILDADRATALVDWADATWDGTTGELVGVFDATTEALDTQGFYWMQLRAGIGTEIYIAEVKVQLDAGGPPETAP